LTSRAAEAPALIRAAQFRRGARWQPYLEAGFHLYFPDSDEAAGVTAGGGVYQLTVRTPVSPAWNVSAGGNLRVAGPVMLNVALSYGRAFRGIA
jgi:hypothetical protein